MAIFSFVYDTCHEITKLSHVFLSAYSLNLCTLEPASMAFLQPNTVFKGVMMQEYPFDFTISKKQAAKNECKVEGTIVWPTVANNKTAVKGSCVGANFEFSEVKLLEGDEAAVPVSYKGRFNSASNTVSGTFESGDGDAQGRFELNV